jgi:hypothetical protein
MQKMSLTLVLLSVLLASANSSARGGPAAPPPTAASSAPAESGKTAAAATSASSSGSTSAPKTAPAQDAAPDAEDKDINPFTGQSLSEAQLRRTLEREKLITAIASEKTKQTQSNSELKMAQLRNAAEKSRLATETRVLAPLPVATPSASPPASARARPSSPVASRSEIQPPSMPWSDVPGSAASNAPRGSAGTRAEIRFADELVELKAGPARNPSVVASVDAQRSADQNQPRAITPISVGPAGLPAPQTLPGLSPIVPSPLSTSVQR